MEESVELATILLTDLVGSTVLSHELGPARTEELREVHFGLLRSAIDLNGGTEVKNTGDGLMVAFSSASAAVRCAVSMQQLIERRARNLDHALHVRIGLGAGEATVKDGDYFGMPAIEAARLCEDAPADGILASATVRILAGWAGGVTFEPAGRRELKGFPEPLETFEISWAPLAEESAEMPGWPLPGPLRSMPQLGYAGRFEERALLDDSLVRAQAGQRQVVLVAGEPGIGKTRLVFDAAHRAHARGFAVCWGPAGRTSLRRTSPGSRSARSWSRRSRRRLLARHAERHRGELQRIVPALSSRIPGVPTPQISDSETERYLLFTAVIGLLREVAAAMPLCVVHRRPALGAMRSR